jgi:hypothetical protein
VARLAGHATLWLALLAAAFVCLGRAWALGRGGFDEHGNVWDPVQYNSVTLWGVLGIGAAFFFLLDLVVFLNPLPPPAH